MRFFLWFALIMMLVGCGGNGNEVAQIPTDTLAPLVSLTPRYTATIAVTRTPLPTFTPTPSITPIPPTPSDTFTPTEIPPVFGIISSLQKVNVREGPGAGFSAFEALDAGVQVEVIGKNPEGSWLNIRLNDGREGWANATLVRVEPSPQPFPSVTPPVDSGSTAVGGTPLPTALLGEGTVTAAILSAGVTPSPTLELVTPTANSAAVTPTTASNNSESSGIPVIDTTAVFQTATALAAGVVGNGTPAVTPISIGATNTLPGAGVPTTSATAAATTLPGSTSVQQGVDVLAYCDNPRFASPPPRNLAAGSTIDVFWAWFAKTPEQVKQHTDNAIYEVRINGKLIENWQQYAGSVKQESDGNYHIYWYVRSESLPAGQVKITYKVTWRQQITDGFTDFGPGTNRPSEEGTCTFNVQ